ncbi:MAG: hypothetical protein ACYTXY_51220, partial [Nostoc sp.]
KNRINSLTNFNKIGRLPKNLFSNFILKEDATVKVISEESKLRLLSELAIRPMLRVFYANSQAVLNYVPQTYPKGINLFRTKVQSNIANEDASMGWDRLIVG